MLARRGSVRCRTSMWCKTWTSQGLYPTDTGSVISGTAFSVPTLGEPCRRAPVRPPFCLRFADRRFNFRFAKHACAQCWRRCSCSNSPASIDGQRLIPGQDTRCLVHRAGVQHRARALSPNCSTLSLLSTCKPASNGVMRKCVITRDCGVESPQENSARMNAIRLRRIPDTGLLGEGGLPVSLQSALRPVTSGSWPLSAWPTRPASTGPQRAMSASGA